MNKRILVFLLAILMLGAVLTAAAAQEAVQYDEWLTSAIAGALGYDSFADCIAGYGYSAPPDAVFLRLGTINYNEGGTRSDDLYQEGGLRFPDRDIIVQLTDAQLQALQAEMDAQFPYDYFSKLPGGYSYIEIQYETDGTTETRRPAYTVMSTECAVGTYDDLEAFAGVIDLKDYITATIDNYVSAEIQGWYEGGVVFISSDFAAADVYTEVTLIPAIP